MSSSSADPLLRPACGVSSPSAPQESKSSFPRPVRLLGINISYSMSSLPTPSPSVPSRRKHKTKKARIESQPTPRTPQASSEPSSDVGEEFFSPAAEQILQAINAQDFKAALTTCMRPPNKLEIDEWVAIEVQMMKAPRVSKRSGVQGAIKLTANEIYRSMTRHRLCGDICRSRSRIRGMRGRVKRRCWRTKVSQPT